MADPSSALHNALFQALSTALSVDVYDAVPDSAAYPYVVLDSNLSTNADFLNDRMDDAFIRINVWSEQRGQSEALGIIGEIDAAMHDNKLSLDTGTVVKMRVERKETRRDVDDVTYSGLVMLRVMTQH